MIAKRLANGKRIANIQRGSACRSEKFPPVSMCSKVMERIVKFVIIRFADSRQHGSLHGRSCLTNLLHTSEQWTRAFDKTGRLYLRGDLILIHNEL